MRMNQRLFQVLTRPPEDRLQVSSDCSEDITFYLLKQKAELHTAASLKHSDGTHQQLNIERNSSWRVRTWVSGQQLETDVKSLIFTSGLIGIVCEF